MQARGGMLLDYEAQATACLSRCVTAWLLSARKVAFSLICLKLLGWHDLITSLRARLTMRCTWDVSNRRSAMTRPRPRRLRERNTGGSDAINAIFVTSQTIRRC